MHRPIFLFTILLALLFCNGCQKNLSDSVNDQDKKIEDLRVSSDFNWKTSHDVSFLIATEFSGVITITSEDGAVLYHKGYYNHLNSSYDVTVNLPAYLQKVLVNGQSVTITGNTVNVTLSGVKAGLKNSSAPLDYQIPLDGLIAAWHFDENSGNTLADAAAGHNGEISNPSWVAGIRGSSLNFNGSTSMVRVPNAGFNPTGSEISFSFWFRLGAVGDDGCFIFQNVKYIVSMDAQGRVGFAVYTPLWKSLNSGYGSRVLDTDWHHVVTTYDGSNMKIYLDGVRRTTLANTGNLQTTGSDVFIGKQNSINPFKGQIDEMLVYDRALNQTEILQIFGASPDPGNGSDNLISYWKLDENSGSTANDSKGTNHATVTGATWGEGISGSCLKFDGTTGVAKAPTKPDLSPVFGITMMAWAKTNRNATTKIFQKGDYDGHGLGQGNWTGWDGHIMLSDNSLQRISWNGGLPVFDQWYHLAMTYDGTQLKYYVNGQLKNSMTIQGVLGANARDLSIGSDAGLQKFFSGSIDECKFFNRALDATEIQSNYSQTGNSPDKDGDGVKDTEDEYPGDPARAFNNYFPAAGFGSLAFEDLWPQQGDYDFNDLVLDYRFTTITGASNKVTEIRAAFVIRAIGAGLNNGFGFQLPGVALQNSDIEVNGTRLTENFVTLNENGTEAGQKKTTVIVFDNVFNIVAPISGFGVNTVPGNPYVKPDTTVISILFSPDKYSVDDIGLSNFNPFLIINKERGKELHLPDYPPTDLANLTYLGSGQDRSDPGAGRYYKTGNNLPWAINIASSYDYTIESSQITSAYLKFASWAESSGTLYPDWFLNSAGYRNAASIYQVP